MLREILFLSPNLLLVVCKEVVYLLSVLLIFKVMVVAGPFEAKGHLKQGNLCTSVQ